MAVKFTDNTVQVTSTMRDACIAWLEEVAGEIQTRAGDYSPVAKINGGNLQNSWKKIVDEEELKATIGNTNEYAIYQEYGTGIYAVKGDGRKTPWVYKSDKDNKFYRTAGNKPRHMLEKAFDKVRKKAQEALEAKLKGL